MAGFGDLGNAAAEGIQPVELKGLSEAVGLATNQVKGFVGTLQQAISPFTELTALAAHFTEAIDPALVAELGRAFKDLQAVIGSAMRPIVDEARELVRYIGGVLMPVMRRLTPIVEELSAKIGQGLKTAVSELADLFDDIEPFLDDIKDILSGLVDIIHDVSSGLNVMGSVGLQAVKDLFAAISGGDVKGSVKDLMASVRDAVQSAIKALLLFSAQLMKAFGWAKGIDAMVAALNRAGKGPRGAEDDRGMAVASGAMFKSISDLGKSVYESAFVASAYQKKALDPAQQAADFLKEIAEDIQGMPDAETLGKMFDDMAGKIEDRVTKFADNKWKEVENYANLQIRTAKQESTKWLGAKLDAGWTAIKNLPGELWNKIKHGMF